MKKNRRVKIRRATEDDAAAIAAVDVETWRAAYRGMMPTDYLSSLSIEDRATVVRNDLLFHGERGRKRTLVAEDEQGIVGYSLAGIPTGSTVGLLYMLYVLPRGWGTGASAALMDGVMADFADQGVSRAELWVLADNRRARLFYERMGWRPDGRTRTDHYGDVELEAMLYSISVPVTAMA